MEDHVLQIIVAFIGLCGSVFSAAIGAFVTMRTTNKKAPSAPQPVPVQPHVSPSAAARSGRPARPWLWIGLFAAGAVMLSCFCGYLSLVSLTDLINDGMQTGIVLPPQPICWIDPYYLIPVCS